MSIAIFYKFGFIQIKTQLAFVVLTDLHLCCSVWRTVAGYSPQGLVCHSFRIDRFDVGFCGSLVSPCLLAAKKWYTAIAWSYCYQGFMKPSLCYGFYLRLLEIFDWGEWFGLAYLLKTMQNMFRCSLTLNRFIKKKSVYKV